MWGEAKTEVGFFAKFPLLSEMQTLSQNCWSDKLLTTTIAIRTPRNLQEGTFK